MLVAIVLHVVGCRQLLGIEDPDIAVDASVPPAAGMINVIATASGAAMVGAPVYTHDADGVVIDTAITDAAGHAGIMQGPYVTIATPFRGETASNELLTLADPSAGEVVRFEAVAPPPTDELAFQILAPEDATSGVVAYHVFTTCGDGGGFPASGAGVLDLAVVVRPCGGPADVAVVSVDDQGRLVGTLAMTTTVLAGATVSLTGAYVGIPPSPISYQTAPSSIASVSVERTSVTPRGRLATVIGGAPITGDSALVDLPVPVMADSAEVIHTRAIPATMGAFARHSLTTWGPPIPARTISLAATLRDYTSPPTFDLATRTVSWTEAPSGGDIADHTLVILYTVQDQAGWTWRVGGPRTGTTIVLPTLPPALAHLSPTQRTIIPDLAMVASAQQVGDLVLALDDPSVFGTGSGLVLQQGLYAGDL